jgi:hypothetical protein
VIDRLNPSNLDVIELRRIMAHYDPRLLDYDTERLIAEWSDPSQRRDDFASAGIERVEDIRDAFCRNLYWGCEADDPLVGLAFDPTVNPLGATIPAIMGSDIAHWDVPDFTEPLAEAYELVEHGHLTREAFREAFRHFVFVNPVRFYAGSNPDFFGGTAIASEAAAVIQADSAQCPTGSAT